jgi:hypothetical protein
MLLFRVFFFLLTCLSMVKCPNCDIEIQHDRGLVLHLNRYCKALNAATTSALAERRERGEAIAEATRLRRLAYEQEQQEELQQFQAPDVSVRVSLYATLILMQISCVGADA